MKMGDGGFRPAFNFQYATDTESQVIIGVEVITAGSDQGQLAPMVEQVSERYGQVQENWLVDGGYPGHGQIDVVAENTTVYAPVPKAKAPRVDIHQPKAKDSAVMAEWRQRMASDEAKRLYKDRASTAECVNALAHNLMRTVTLAPHLVGIGTGTFVVPQIAG